MKDMVNFKGHFKIQALDADHNVLDEWEEDNMIMETARESMAEMFANLTSSTFINKFVLGTEGHVGTSVITPKGSGEGFVKERDRLFSEVLAGTVNTNDTLTIVRLNDVIYAEPNTAATGYYKYLGAETGNYVVTDALLEDTLVWEYIGATAPYTYNITFDLPGTQVDLPDGDLAGNIVEDDVAAGSTIKVLQSGTAVTFSIDISTSAGNSQNGTTSIFTEAALYANSRIFAMKTFKAKVKDSTVLLRVDWTITF